MDVLSSQGIESHVSRVVLLSIQSVLWNIMLMWKLDFIVKLLTKQFPF